VVELTNNADGFVIADAIRVERLSPPSQIVDDGNPGFIATGAWARANNTGYQSDELFTPAGNGSSVARWTAPVTPGEYAVFATWSGHPNRASNTPFVIFDSITPSAPVLVDQRQTPSSIQDQGIDWFQLGTFTMTGNQLAVQMTNNANGFVIADAIRIERTAPARQIVDDGNPGFVATGAWARANNAGHQGDESFSAPGDGTSIARWNAALLAGVYRVSVTWSAHPNRASNAAFVINDGATDLETVLVNQRLAPTTFGDQGSDWYDLGTFTISAQLLVQVSNNTDGFVIADAIRIERIA
jgi:hypothetical protein